MGAVTTEGRTQALERSFSEFHGTAGRLRFPPAILPLLAKHISIRRLFKHSKKGNVEEGDYDLHQRLSRFPFQSTLVADVVKYVRLGDFPVLDGISELAAHDGYHVIDDYGTYYVTGFVM